MMQSILGIDVSKDSLDVDLVNNGRQIQQVMSNNSVGHQHLQNWLVAQGAGQVHACLEATGKYGEAVAEYLYERGHQVSVVNPARIKRYGESKLHRNKTDKADAALIAEFCQKENPPLWAPLPLQVKQLRALVRRLDDLQTAYQQERNRMLSGERDAWVLADLQAHLDYLQERMRAARQAIQQQIEQHPNLKSQQELLISIPGIGKLTAAKLLGEIGDFSTFEDAPQLAAFAGLNPKIRRSGSSVYKKTRISKEGRAVLRKILYMPTIVARKHNPIIREFSARLSARKIPVMAIIAAAMRKLLHLIYGVLKNRLPFDPNFGIRFSFGP
jgi:transposase